MSGNGSPRYQSRVVRICRVPVPQGRATLAQRFRVASFLLFQLPRVPRPCRVFCDRAGTLTVPIGVAHLSIRLPHPCAVLCEGWEPRTAPYALKPTCISLSHPCKEQGWGSLSFQRVGQPHGSSLGKSQG